jgi:hypothetical protein
VYNGRSIIHSSSISRQAAQVLKNPMVLTNRGFPMTVQGRGENACYAGFFKAARV